MPGDTTVAEHERLWRFVQHAGLRFDGVGNLPRRLDDDERDSIIKLRQTLIGCSADGAGQAMFEEDDWLIMGQRKELFESV